MCLHALAGGHKRNPTRFDAAIRDTGQICTVGRDVVLTIRKSALTLRCAVVVGPATVDVAAVVSKQRAFWFIGRHGGGNWLHLPSVLFQDDG